MFRTYCILTRPRDTLSAKVCAELIQKMESVFVCPPLNLTLYYIIIIRPPSRSASSHDRYNILLRSTSTGAAHIK